MTNKELLIQKLQDHPELRTWQTILLWASEVYSYLSIEQIAIHHKVKLEDSMDEWNVTGDMIKMEDTFYMPD